MKKYSLILFLFLVFSSPSASSPDARDGDDPGEFLFKGRLYRLEIKKSGGDTDIFLTNAREKNLSQELSGENLFPRVFIQENRYLVSWNNYWNRNVALCFYDSSSDKSQRLPMRGFNFISRPEIIFQGENPHLFIFKGNNSNNDDLFLCELDSKKLINITRSPENEKIFSLNPDGNLVFIDTETLYHRYRFQLDIETLEISLLEKKIIDRDPKKIPWVWDSVSLNTIIAFGDSITCGEMRMEDLEGELHPELAYLAKVQEKLEDYGETHTINLGESATSSYHGVERMDSDLKENPGRFFLILYGTNDVGGNLFSAVSSAENLEWICLNARNKYGMVPVISTVPPQQLWEIGVQVFKENTEELNARIIAFALQDAIAYIDSYTAFFECDEGWVACLEDIKGNHPSPLGHDIMAERFKPKILEIPPAEPSDMQVIGTTGNAITVQWSENLEFDFGKCTIQFGYSPDLLDHATSSELNTFTFLNLPLDAHILSDIYLRIQAEDQDGNASDSSPVFHIQFPE